jgi:flavin-binding protein dodecin
MSIAKVIEILAEGESIEKAVEAAVAEAGRTVRRIRSVYIADMQAIVRDGKVKKYRVNTRISFILDGDDD